MLRKLQQTLGRNQNQTKCNAFNLINILTINNSLDNTITTTSSNRFNES